MSQDLSTPGRRSAGDAGGRVSLPTVLAVALPLLTLLVLLPVRAHEPEPRVAVPPTETSLGRADVGCPASLTRGGTVLIGTTADAEGPVTVSQPGSGGTKQRQVDVAPGLAAQVSARGPVVVTGTEALAPGLLAARVGARPLSVTSCPQPSAETWFSGLGASSTRSSAITLTNPDPGPAVVDVVLSTKAGELDAPSVRGVAVPGRGTLTLDLSREVPTRRTLAARVDVVRGRAAVSVSQTVDPVGRAAATTEWLPGQSEPAETLLLPGLPARTTGHTLVLANPGADEARVEVQLVGRSTFTPTTSKQVRVPGGSVVSTALPWLAKELRRGPDTVAVQVSSTQPVTASLESHAGGDPVLTGVPDAITGTGAAVLPAEARGSLVLTGAQTSGAATVTVTDRRGRELTSQEVRLQPGSGTRLDLPRGATFVRVEARRTSVVAAVELTGASGAAVLPLVEPPTAGRVPSVRPVLP